MSKAASSELLQNKIKTALKIALKRRGHTYKDVAEVWECSEPTVKRLLGSESLTLDRLLTLLDWLGLTLAQLHEMAESDSLEHPRFTARQLEFLAKDSRAFAFYMMLYDTSATPASIAKKYELSERELQRLLIQLEKYDLITVGLKGKLRPAYARPPHLEGALGAVHMNRVIDGISQYFKSRIAYELARQQRGLESGEKGGLQFNIADVTPKTYREYLEKFTRLANELEEAARLDDAIQDKKNLKPMVMMTGFHLDDGHSSDIEAVKDVFGGMLRSSPTNSF